MTIHHAGIAARRLIHPEGSAGIALHSHRRDTRCMSRELQVVSAAELARTYAGAMYAVRLDGDALPLRVGQPAQDLEAYWPATRYMFITAWNPASEPHSDGANEAADALLVAELAGLGLATQPAWAEDETGRWREPGWVLADPEPATVDRLAQQFGQAAVLVWEHGQPVRLRMMLPRPAGATSCDHTDWLE